MAGGALKGAAVGQLYGYLVVYDLESHRAHVVAGAKDIMMKALLVSVLRTTLEEATTSNWIRHKAEAGVSIDAV
jgi:hypothetical protein